MNDWRAKSRNCSASKAERTSTPCSDGSAVRCGTYDQMAQVAGKVVFTDDGGDDCLPEFGVHYVGAKHRE